MSSSTSRKVTVLITTPHGYTADDVLAYVLGLQHERNLIDNAKARNVRHLTEITFTYPNLPGEIADVKRRILAGSMPVDVIVG